MDSPKRNWRLGEILVQQGWVTWQQLESALQMQTRLKKGAEVNLLVEHGFISGKEGKNLCLGEILVKNGWLSWKHLEEGLEVQHQTGRILGEILMEKKFVLKENLYRALAEQFKKPFVKLDELTIPAAVIQSVPKYLAMEYKIMPLLRQNDVLLIAISNPQDVRAETGLRGKVADAEIRTVIASPDDIQKAIARYYGP